MEKVTTTNGNYYPIRDECKQATDPKQGCITTDALYYETKLNSNDKIDVLLKHGEHIIFSQSYPRHIQYVYDIFDFDCSNDKYCLEIRDWYVGIDVKVCVCHKAVIWTISQWLVK